MDHSMNSNAIAQSRQALLDALHSSRPVSGLTHNFYRYPARMSPDLARYVIEEFTSPGEMVLDPFMGGGTTIVESLALGRRAIGIDINPVAHFVTRVKTTPLLRKDRERIARWASELQGLDYAETRVESPDPESYVRNLPSQLAQFLGHARATTDDLPTRTLKEFARCVLLRLGQWAVEVAKQPPDVDSLKSKLQQFSIKMLEGVEEFSDVVSLNGGNKRTTIRNRSLILGSALDSDVAWAGSGRPDRPTLVLTSPPYPGVHVLYHRWQVYGRKETPAPYMLISAADGAGEGHYTLGGRSEIGQTKYFQSITTAFASVKRILQPNGLVVQLVSFADPGKQLPLYLEAMDAAGFVQAEIDPVPEQILWRSVPRRKWYNRVRGVQTFEALLLHRPAVTPK